MVAALKRRAGKCPPSDPGEGELQLAQGFSSASPMR
jgi:hypothetical protein